jgi:hypothetical protein
MKRRSARRADGVVDVERPRRLGGDPLSPQLLARKLRRARPGADQLSGESDRRRYCSEHLARAAGSGEQGAPEGRVGLVSCGCQRERPQHRCEYDQHEPPDPGTARQQHNGDDQRRRGQYTQEGQCRHSQQPRLGVMDRAPGRRRRCGQRNELLGRQLERIARHQLTSARRAEAGTAGNGLIAAWAGHGLKLPRGRRRHARGAGVPSDRMLECARSRVVANWSGARTVAATRAAACPSAASGRAATSPRRATSRA